MRIGIEKEADENRTTSQPNRSAERQARIKFSIDLANAPPTKYDPSTATVQSELLRAHQLPYE